MHAEVGQRIRELRQKRGLLQEELARKRAYRLRLSRTSSRVVGARRSIGSRKSASR